MEIFAVALMISALKFGLNKLEFWIMEREKAMDKERSERILFKEI